jgi:sigma-B regulation protein RsbQ
MVAMSVLERNNVHVTGAASGAPMMFAHGFGCDQQMWRFVAPAFEAEHPVVLFDAVGAGASDASAFDEERHGSLDGYALDVLEICDALELSDVVFVGHSVAAMVGVLAAIRRPELFRRLVLVAPSPRYLDDEGYVGGFELSDVESMLDSLASNYVGWAAAMAPAIMGNGERPQLGDELAASFCRTDPAIAEHFARVTFLSDNRADLARVSTPTLVLQCSDDLLAPDAVGAYVQQQIAGSTLLRLQATGHCPNVSAPGEVIAAIRSAI